MLPRNEVPEPRRVDRELWREYERMAMLFLKARRFIEGDEFAEASQMNAILEEPMCYLDTEDRQRLLAMAYYNIHRAIPIGVCECEHRGHTDGEDSYHEYGELVTELVTVETDYGPFKVCPKCRDECLAHYKRS